MSCIFRLLGSVLVLSTGAMGALLLREGCDGDLSFDPFAATAAPNAVCRAVHVFPSSTVWSLLLTVALVTANGALLWATCAEREGPWRRWMRAAAAITISVFVLALNASVAFSGAG